MKLERKYITLEEFLEKLDFTNLSILSPDLLEFEDEDEEYVDKLSSGHKRKNSSTSESPKKGGAKKSEPKKQKLFECNTVMKQTKNENKIDENKSNEEAEIPKRQPELITGFKMDVL